MRRGTLFGKSLSVLLLLMFSVFLGGMSQPATVSAAAGDVALYTPYTGIAVAPGESVNYTIEVINDSRKIQRVSLEIAEQPKGWEASLTAGGWNIRQLSVRPEESESFQLQTSVPLKVEKGTYRFTIRATDSDGAVHTLPISIEVTETGTFRTELEVEQPNMEGDADSTFQYEMTLHNRTAAEQLYALSTSAPRGWQVEFAVSGQKVTSVKVEANGSQVIDVTVRPPSQVEAGTYAIPIKAQAGSSTAETTLEAVITGTYGLELSTPTGNLNGQLTVGGEKKMELVVTNTGSSELRGIELTASTPVDWEVRFEPETIDVLAPGETATVQAFIKSSPKAIAGDYIVSVEASTPETTAKADLRMSVKTSMLWGLVGVVIIALVAAGIWYLFRKYGRQ
ncbi:MAG: hypothetical protein A6D91_05505 [Bacillaceae bacterium G1]|nr:MAG: hypothetical protein A6D91_05505 [Bacillaceae bacterium G1]